MMAAPPGRRHSVQSGTGTYPRAAMPSRIVATAFLGGVRSLGLFRAVAPSTTPGAVVTAGLPTWQLVVVLGLFGLLALLCLFILRRGHL